MTGRIVRPYYLLTWCQGLKKWSGWWGPSHIENLNLPFSSLNSAQSIPDSRNPACIAYAKDLSESSMAASTSKFSIPQSYRAPAQGQRILWKKIKTRPSPGPGNPSAAVPSLRAEELDIPEFLQEHRQAVKYVGPLLVGFRLHFRILFPNLV